MMTIDTTNMCSHLQKKICGETIANIRTFASSKDKIELRKR